jgi:peptidyl-prolyl cis-trans isomerase C
MRKLVLKSVLFTALVSATGSVFAQQSGLPINAAASVNGVIITNDMVKQGIRVALSQAKRIPLSYVKR